jgi:hypothetical protein
MNAMKRPSTPLKIMGATSRQRVNRWDVLANLVEHENLHDARRSVQQRGEDLQNP